MFLQANVLVLAIDVLFLAVFAMSVENAMGRVRFACFYLLGGLVALAAQIALAPNSADPTLGAEGAIAAVLGAYIVLYPRARILTVALVPFFLGPVEVPAWAMLVLWFAIDGGLGALGLTAPLGASSAITYYAQIGGVAFGLLVVRAFAPRHSVELAAGH
jgi:membrane associated rhomboid family serine protease